MGVERGQAALHVFVCAMCETARQAHYQALAEKFGFEYQGGPSSQAGSVIGVFRGRAINLQTKTFPTHLRVGLPLSFLRGYSRPSVLLRNVYRTISISLTLAVINVYPYVSFSVQTKTRWLKLWEEFKYRAEGKTTVGAFHQHFVIEINPETFFDKVFKPEICQRLNHLAWPLNLELGAGGLVFEQVDDLTDEQAETMLTLMSDIADRVEALQNH